VPFRDLVAQRLKVGQSAEHGRLAGDDAVMPRKRSNRVRDLVEVIGQL
jgi:hypothetical protein